MTDEGAKRLSAAVLLRAAEDYKKNPKKYADEIEEWLKSDPICVNIVLPLMTGEDIIRRFKKYAKDKRKQIDTETETDAQETKQIS